MPLCFDAYYTPPCTPTPHRSRSLPAEYTIKRNPSTLIGPEQTIITVVAHLCARLLESSAEIRSTILVQRSYRTYLERTGRGDLVERARAAKAEARARAAAANAAAREGRVAELAGLPPTTPLPPGRRDGAACAGAVRPMGALSLIGECQTVSE